MVQQSNAFLRHAIPEGLIAKDTNQVVVVSRAPSLVSLPLSLLKLLTFAFVVSCNDTISDSEDPNAVLPLNNGPGNMCYDIDCPYYVEENYKYTSPNLPDGFYELGDVATEEECAEKCKERSFECKFFTFVRAGEVDSGCHLKACDGGREAASINYRSGGYQCLRENQGKEKQS